ncbi:MAG: phosphatidylserine decarboxylase [Rhodospirillales bacterium]|jgi:phosphatidylserine decarboxylase
MFVKILMVPIHRDGWPFIAIFVVATILLGSWSYPLGFIGTVLTVWCICFFRNPPRTTPTRPDLLVSAADGVIQSIESAPPPAELHMGEEPRTRIAVFMNVFNVHVNRIPCEGIVSALAYRHGRFIDASLDKASEHNERQSLRLDIGNGRDLAVVQIAGLIARRIRCDAVKGQHLHAGAYFGLIRFGSRVDIYLPLGANPLVAVGQKAVAGETVFADLASDEPPRAAKVQ